MHRTILLILVFLIVVVVCLFSSDENHFQWKTFDYEARINVFVIALKDYETMSDDVIGLRKTAVCIGVITAKYDTDLSTVRKIITQMNKNNNTKINSYSDSYESVETIPIVQLHLSNSWVFIDSTTAASRLFRIDKEQEYAHFLTDVCNMEDLFIIDSSLESYSMYNGSNVTRTTFVDDSVPRLSSPSSIDDNQLNKSMLETNSTVENKCISKEVEQMNETNRLNNRLIQTDINTILSSNDPNENVHEDNNDSDDDDNDDDDDEESIHKTKSRNTLTSTKNTSFEEDLSSSSVTD